MSGPLPIAYLNGTFLPIAEARVSPLDRAFLFGDSVYEVLPVYGGRPFLFEEHSARLDRSLREIRMAPVHTRAEWAAIYTELVARNGGGDLYLYVQVTRGAEFGRNHAIPTGLVPTVFAMCTRLAPLAANALTDGVSGATLQDPRWRRCDIKSTSLLANVLAKSAAVDAGAFEAVLLDDGELREGSSTSVIVVKGGRLYVPPDGHEILPGTTRALALSLAARAGVEAIVAPVSEQALRAADEIVLSFATRGVLPLTRLDGVAVGTGRPGPVWRRLYEAFEAYKAEVAGTPLLQ